MKGLNKIEPPQQGHDIRNYGAVLKALCDRANLLWTVKPDGDFTMGENGVVLTIPPLTEEEGYRINVAISGAAYTLLVVALEPPTAVP